jgi:hypothetical protein
VSKVLGFRVKQRAVKAEYDPLDPANTNRFNPYQVRDDDWGMLGHYLTFTDSRGRTFLKLST